MTKDAYKIYCFCKEEIEKLSFELNKTEDINEQIKLMAKMNSLWDVALKCYDITEDYECLRK